VHYSHTEEFRDEITAFATLCLPQLQRRFHMEYIAMQRALHSFDEVSPSYLAGDNGISLSINVSHNFANSSHYVSLDYGPSIVLWVLDDKASRNCDQYLIFNNIIETVGNIQNKKGVMIKICDGMLMSFQGSSLRHGTTIRRDSGTGLLCPKGSIYGIHFGLTLPTLTLMRRKRIDQYMTEMCITPRVLCRPNTELIQQGLSVKSKRKKKKCQINYQKQKLLDPTQVQQYFSKLANADSDYKTASETEERYREQIASESNKDLFVLVEKGTKDAMNKSLHILKYEQIIPNWKVFYMKIRKNLIHLDKY